MISPGCAGTCMAPKQGSDTHEPIHFPLLALSRGTKKKLELVPYSVVFVPFSPFSARSEGHLWSAIGALYGGVSPEHVEPVSGFALFMLYFPLSIYYDEARGRL